MKEWSTILQTISCSSYDLVLDDSISRFQQVLYVSLLKQALFHSHSFLLKSLQSRRWLRVCTYQSQVQFCLDDSLERYPAKATSRCTYWSNIQLTLLWLTFSLSETSFEFYRSCILSTKFCTEECYRYASLREEMTIRASMNLKKDSEIRGGLQNVAFVCQNHKLKHMLADTWCFCLLTEPNVQPSGQPSDLLGMNIQQDIDLNIVNC